MDPSGPVWFWVWPQQVPEQLLLRSHHLSVLFLFLRWRRAHTLDLHVHSQGNQPGLSCTNTSHTHTQADTQTHTWQTGRLYLLASLSWELSGKKDTILHPVACWLYSVMFYIRKWKRYLNPHDKNEVILMTFLYMKRLNSSRDDSSHKGICFSNWNSLFSGLFLYKNLIWGLGIHSLFVTPTLPTVQEVTVLKN